MRIGGAVSSDLQLAGEYGSASTGAGRRPDETGRDRGVIKEAERCSRIASMRPLCGLLNLPRLETSRADSYALDGPVNNGPYALEVNLECALRLACNLAPDAALLLGKAASCVGVARCRSSSADFALPSHIAIPFSLMCLPESP